MSHLGGRQFSSKGEMNRESERGEEESGERRSAKCGILGCHPYPALSKRRAQGETIAGGDRPQLEFTAHHVLVQSR